MFQPSDTICAIATPSGGARGIVRVSGPAAIAITARLFRPAETLYTIDRSRVLTGEVLLHAAQLPCLLYAWPTVRTYTREPLVELHTLGSLPLLQALVHALCQAGARSAEPGEFTMRAFLSGRIDLTQAEAVLGVIHAQGDRELSVALQQLAGGVAQPMTQVRDDLLDLLAELEAGLDFVEEDIQFIDSSEVRRRLDAARQQVDAMHQQMLTRAEAQHSPRVVLVGSPNVGKSSLFNCLTDGTCALVADAAGTTRDYVTGFLSIDGISCQLIDTAGLLDNAAGTPIDHLAQASASVQHTAAVLQLLCIDATRPLNPWEQQQLAVNPPHRLLVATKTDCRQHLDHTDFLDHAVATSSADGSGIDTLRAAIKTKLTELLPADTPVVAATAHRCRESLRLAAMALSSASQLSAAGQEELVAADVRVALGELGQVVGAVYTDDLLDRIFSRFCIGK